MNGSLDAAGDAASEAGAWPLTIYESLSSTNELIKDRIRSGGALPTSALAFEQTAGYGRQGRSWSSPFGGFYLSIGVRSRRPVADWPTLSMVVGLAVRRAIVVQRPAMDERLWLKWPNDLVVVGDDGGLAKLSGISSEAVSGALCIGIGVNGYRPRGPAPAAYPVAYLFDDEERDDLTGKHWRGRIVELGHGVLDELRQMFARWEREGFAAFVDEYNARNVLAGAEITVSDIERCHERSGVAGHVGVDGRLALIDAAGEARWISSGEAHLNGCLYRR